MYDNRHVMQPLQLCSDVPLSNDITLSNSKTILHTTEQMTKMEHGLYFECIIINIPWPSCGQVIAVNTFEKNYCNATRLGCTVYKGHVIGQSSRIYMLLLSGTKISGTKIMVHWQYSCHVLEFDFITVTPLWARWRPKSPVSRLFTQPFILAQIKENIKFPA